MSPLQCQGELSAPGYAEEEDGPHRLRLPHVAEELANVVQQPAKTGRIAALFLVHPGPTAVEKTDVVPGLAQPAARMLIPAAVTPDPVNGHHAGANGLRVRRRE